MKILLEITILATLNIILFGYVQRKLLLIVTLQRQQLTVYKRKVKRPKLKKRDRFFWMFISKYWSDWKDHLIIVKPVTVTRVRFDFPVSP